MPSVTGQPLSANSVVNVGAFAGSGQDGPISEAFFPAAAGDHRCGHAARTRVPPISPPVLINPHEHRVIDTDHRDLVRVYVQGTLGIRREHDQSRHGLARRGQADRPFHAPVPAQRIPERGLRLRRQGHQPAGRLHDGHVHGPDLQRAADHLVEAGPQHPVLCPGAGPAPFPDGQGVGLPGAREARRDPARGRPGGRTPRGLSRRGWKPRPSAPAAGSPRRQRQARHEVRGGGAIGPGQLQGPRCRAPGRPLPSPCRDRRCRSLRRARRAPVQAPSNIPGKLQRTLNDYLDQASFYRAGTARNASASAV